MNNKDPKKTYRIYAFIYLVASIFIGGLVLMFETSKPIMKILGPVFLIYLLWQSWRFFRASQNSRDNTDE